MCIFTAMEAKYDIHDIVYFHRKEAGLSRNALARLAGVGKTAIYDLEKGKKGLRWNTILSILECLNIQISFNSPLMKAYAKSRDLHT